MSDNRIIWLPVVGWEGIYAVSNTGLIMRVLKSQGTRNELILKAHVTWNGYLYCILCFNGIKKHMSVHRAVALAFIHNPDNKREVNHKDGSL